MSGGPSPIPSSSSSLSSNWSDSFKKTSNAQGGQSRVSVPVVNSSDSGIQTHHMQPQGMMNQGQSSSFTIPFGLQLPPQPPIFNYPVNQGSQNVPFTYPSVLNTPQVDKSSTSTNEVAEPPNSEHNAVNYHVDDDRRSKLLGPFAPGTDLRPDIEYGGNICFQPVQGGNYGVLRNPRAQTPVQYVGGTPFGPMQAMSAQAGMQRNGLDTDKWQHDVNFQQTGLIHSSQTRLQMRRKAQKKYEVGNVRDEEQAKQRQLKGILNQLTPRNFEKLLEQVKAVNIDNAVTLAGFVSQIFDKALMEPTFCEMYADFCYHLAGELPDFGQDNRKISFKRLLVNKCQEEFERGEREQEEANKAEEKDEIKQSEDEREDKRIKARRQRLGNIRLIGELYKKKMLTEGIMHMCIKKLIGQYQNPDEEDVEALCILMNTIGEIIDHPKVKKHMDAYFDIMTELSNNMRLSSSVRSMLKETINLRKNKWQQGRRLLLGVPKSG